MRQEDGLFFGKNKTCVFRPNPSNKGRFSILNQKLLGWQSDGRGEEVRFGRLLRHCELCMSDMIQMGVVISMSGTANRHVLLVQDSSEISFGFTPFQSGLSKFWQITRSDIKYSNDLPSGTILVISNTLDSGYEKYTYSQLTMTERTIINNISIINEGQIIV